MHTLRMRVRDITPDDAPAVLAIAQQNGMLDYVWPRDSWGAVAELAGRAVAFCAGRDVHEGLLIEDLWCERSFDGRRGLAALSAWVESAAEKAATDLGVEIHVGGIVHLGNDQHAAALRARGYELTHYVYSKRIPPHGQSVSETRAASTISG